MADEIKEIIQRLEQQRSAIERALQALMELEGGAGAPAAPAGRRRGRPPANAAAKTPAKRESRMTPEGRKRLSDSLKKRWAAKRSAAAAQAATKKTASKKSAAKKATKKAAGPRKTAARKNGASNSEESAG